MIVTYIAVAVLCFMGSVRSGALPPDEVDDPCPEDTGCPLSVGESGECLEGECGFYIDNPHDNQCPYDNTHTLLAHPNDCHRYCRCDHSGTAICDMECAEGTRFDGKLGVCVTDTGCSGNCASNPCVHGDCYSAGSGNTPWGCTCSTSCFGWNCHFKPDSGVLPCDDHVCCPAGELCLNEVSQWWPSYIPYTCVPNPCDSNPCLEGGTCVPIQDGADYRCDGCPEACYGKNCDCQRPDPCDSNCDYGTCTSPNRDATGKAICDTFTCRGCPAWACEGVGHANVPHPYHCDRYCACGFGTVNDMPCPAGLLFDAEECICNYPNEVNCYTGGLDELQNWIQQVLAKK